MIFQFVVVFVAILYFVVTDTTVSSTYARKRSVDNPYEPVIETYSDLSNFLKDTVQRLEVLEEGAFCDRHFSNLIWAKIQESIDEGKSTNSSETLRHIKSSFVSYLELQQESAGGYLCLSDLFCDHENLCQPRTSSVTTTIRSIRKQGRAIASDNEDDTMTQPPNNSPNSSKSKSNPSDRINSNQSTTEETGIIRKGPRNAAKPACIYPCVLSVIPIIGLYIGMCIVKSG